jgi:hypothetical protein
VRLRSGDLGACNLSQILIAMSLGKSIKLKEKRAQLGSSRSHPPPVPQEQETLRIEKYAATTIALIRFQSRKR